MASHALTERLVTVPPELRRRAVEAYAAGEGPVRALASRFVVGHASLSRWIALHRATGSVEPRPHGGGMPRRVTAGGEAVLRQWIADDPSTPQHVMADRLADAGQPPVSQQTVGRTLSRMGYTRKKSR